MANNKTRVLIVGGGPGGGFIAKALDKDPAFEVTLVDTKGVFEFVPGTPEIVLRAFTDDELDETLSRHVVPHTEYVKNGRVVVGRATSVGKDLKSVTLASGERLECDYLVLATGSTYAGVPGGDEPSPWKVPPALQLDDAAAYAAYVRELRARTTNEAIKTVLVVGGGIVGVEAAAELAESYPDVDVHLVSASDRLLPDSPKNLGKRAADFFEVTGVTVYHGERAARSEEDGGRVWVTSKTGTRITPDAVLWCVGISPATGYLAESGLGNLLDERGFVRVGPSLDVEGHPHAFAVGDLPTGPFMRTSANAMKHAEFLVPRIKKLSQGKEPKAGAKAPAQQKPQILSLGAKSALADMGAFTLTGFTKRGSSIASKLKNSVWKFVSFELRK